MTKESSRRALRASNSKNNASLCACLRTITLQLGQTAPNLKTKQPCYETRRCFQSFSLSLSLSLCLSEGRRWFVRLDAQQPAKRDVVPDPRDGTRILSIQGWNDSPRRASARERKKDRSRRPENRSFFSSTSRFARVIASSAAYLGVRF